MTRALLQLLSEGIPDSLRQREREREGEGEAEAEGEEGSLFRCRRQEASSLPVASPQEQGESAVPAAAAANAYHS